MKSRFLFPYQLRVVGWALAIPGIILGLLTIYTAITLPFLHFKIREHATLFRPAVEDFTNELALTLTVVGLLFIAFSKQKREDELTERIRLNALYWAVFINYVIYTLFIIIGQLDLYFHINRLAPSAAFFTEQFGFIIFNLFVPLIVFIARFNFLLFRKANEYINVKLRFLPNKPTRIIGQIITAVFVVTLFVLSITEVKNDWVTTIMYLMPFPLLLWAFSLEPTEDEYISSLRLNAMQIAILVNYAILLISNFTFYGLNFLVVLFINLSTIPAIFIIVFNYQLYKIKRLDKAKQRDLNLNLL